MPYAKTTDFDKDLQDQVVRYQWLNDAPTGRLLSLLCVLALIAVLT